MCRGVRPEVETAQVWMDLSALQESLRETKSAKEKKWLVLHPATGFLVQVVYREAAKWVI